MIIQIPSSHRFYLFVVVISMQDGADRFSEAGFPAITYEIDELAGGGGSGGGLSGGAVAGIVIVVLFIVVAVGATAAFIL